MTEKPNNEDTADLDARPLLDEDELDAVSGADAAVSPAHVTTGSIAVTVIENRCIECKACGA